MLPDYLPSVPAEHSGGDGPGESGDDWIDEMNEIASERIDAMLRVFKMKYLIPKNGLMFIMVLLLQGQDRGATMEHLQQGLCLRYLLHKEGDVLLWSVQKRW